MNNKTLFNKKNNESYNVNPKGKGKLIISSSKSLKRNNINNSNIYQEVIAGNPSSKLNSILNQRKLNLINHNNEHKIKTLEEFTNCSYKSKKKLGRNNNNDNKNYSVNNSKTINIETNKTSYYYNNRSNPFKQSNINPFNKKQKLYNSLSTFENSNSLRTLNPSYLPKSPAKGLKKIDILNDIRNNSFYKKDSDNYTELLKTKYKNCAKNASTLTQITTLPGGIKSDNIKDDYKDYNKLNKNSYYYISKNLKSRNDYNSTIDCLKNLDKTASNIKCDYRVKKNTNNSYSRCIDNNNNSKAKNTFKNITKDKNQSNNFFRKSYSNVNKTNSNTDSTYNTIYYNKTNAISTSSNENLHNFNQINILKRLRNESTNTKNLIQSNINSKTQKDNDIYTSVSRQNYGCFSDIVDIKNCVYSKEKIAEYMYKKNTDLDKLNSKYNYQKSQKPSKPNIPKPILSKNTTRL